MMNVGFYSVQRLTLFLQNHQRCCASLMTVFCVAIAADAMLKIRTVEVSFKAEQF